MRLPLLKPSDLDQEQKALYDGIREVTDAAFTNFKFMKDNGELIGSAQIGASDMRASDRFAHESALSDLWA